MLDLPEPPLYLDPSGKKIKLEKSKFVVTKPNLSKGAQGQIDLAECIEKSVRREKEEEIVKDVIIKRIEAIRLQKQPKEVKYIKFELKVPYTLNHPGIVKYITHYQDKKYIYIVQEYIPGRNLFERISREGKFTSRDTAKYGRQIIEALMYLHSKSIMHRDIKLENILISRKTDNVKLVDFGYSCEVDQFRDTCCGTRVYMSPEVRRKQPYSFPSEVWAVGVLLYEMLAGILNIDKFNPEISKFQFPHGFPPLARDVIEIMLTKDPTKRPSFKDVLRMRFFHQEKEESKGEVQSVRTSVKMGEFVRSEEAVKLRKENKFLQKSLAQKDQQLFRELEKGRKYQERQQQIQSEKENLHAIIAQLRNEKKEAAQMLKELRGEVGEKNELQERVLKLQLENQERKHELLLAKREQEEMRNKELQLQSKLSVEIENYRELDEEFKKMREKYETMARSIEHQEKNGKTNELEGYFQSRLWEIEQEVSRSRMQIHAMNVADRTYEIERKSHYDASQGALLDLEKKVQEQVEVGVLREKKEALEIRLRELVKENHRLNGDLQKSEEKVEEMSEAKEKLNVKSEALQKLQKQYVVLDEQLAFKEDWIETLTLTINELEKKREMELRQRTTIFQDDYFNK